MSMHATYRIGAQEFKSFDSHLSQALEQAREQRIAPLCLCLPRGIEMYSARIGERFYIKRMPNTGSTHASSCDSYEPPPEVSGLAQVIDSAIRENPEDGTVALMLDFSLRKMPGRAPPVLTDHVADTAKAKSTRLTLRAMLHYLWDDAGFTRWSPAMARKRNWFVVRKYLLQAAQNKLAKGNPLSSLLYIPESFDLEGKQVIEQRRIAQFSPMATASSTRPLLMVIGELKSFNPTRSGFQMHLKHLPNYPFTINEALHKRIHKLFAAELELWDTYADTHLMVIATVSVSASGVSTVEELALMLVNANWIPFENSFDRNLIQHMIDANRYFFKSMRYNLQPDTPVACLVATDTGDKPTAMYLLMPNAGPSYQDALSELLNHSQMHAWLWKVGVQDLPRLPTQALAHRVNAAPSPSLDKPDQALSTPIARAPTNEHQANPI